MQLDTTTTEIQFILAALLAQGTYMTEALGLLARFICSRMIANHVGLASKPFQLADIDPETFRLRFRIYPHEILQLEETLDLPTIIFTAQMCPIPRQEALCLLLRRLAYPSRYEDLRSEFNHQATVLSSAVNTTATIIYNKIKTKMAFDHRMVARYKQRSADAIFDKIGRLTNCLGFIDGTVRRICRPTRFQRQAYSGHKKIHGIKFQSITMANGLFVSLYGPFEGRRHDSYMLSKSEAGSKMANYPGYVLYGDQGNPLRRWLITPYADAELSERQQSFNRDLRKARVAVEWNFGWVVRYWKFFELVCNMKVLKSPIGVLYVVAAFFTNCLSCVRRRNQTSKYFRCRLPTLANYVADLHHNSVNEEDYASDENDDFFDDESDMSDVSEFSSSEDESNADDEHDSTPFIE
ncbi:unnamed protein product [Phytophthora fragariaefolia]|uniref:Unnamed protein product n=1 Tax=Phytophthora fragariaefolia TaxID=1490495 RepID=A0A9W6THN7_9STRA|nr:unnamed protein product [Phytophthora fragariaefolia]